MEYWSDFEMNEILHSSIELECIKVTNIMRFRRLNEHTTFDLNKRRCKVTRGSMNTNLLYFFFIIELMNKRDRDLRYIESVESPRISMNRKRTIIKLNASSFFFLFTRMDGYYVLTMVKLQARCLRMFHLLFPFVVAHEIYRFRKGNLHKIKNTR